MGMFDDFPEIFNDIESEVTPTVSVCITP